MENVFDVADPPEEPGPEDVGPESLVPDCYRPGDWKSEQDLCACSGRGSYHCQPRRQNLWGTGCPVMPNGTNLRDTKNTMSERKTLDESLISIMHL